MTFSYFTISQDGKTITDVSAPVERVINTAAGFAKKNGSPACLIAHMPDGSTRKATFNPDGTNDRIWNIAPGKELTPAIGEVYTNRGGGRFGCLSVLEPVSYKYYSAGDAASSSVAVFRNVVSGWTFTAKGIFQYIDGTIEWNCSVDGRFEEIEE